MAKAEKFVFFEHLESSYCRLLYNEAGKVMRFLEVSKPSLDGHRGGSNYLFCRLLLKLVLDLTGTNKVEAALSQLLSKLDEVSLAEQVMLFELLGGASIGYISTGDRAVLPTKAFML